MKQRGIKWDGPARDAFGENAPDNLVAWQHAWNIGFNEAARQLGISPATINGSVRHPLRAGIEPYDPDRVYTEAPPPPPEPEPKPKPPPPPEPEPEPRPELPNLDFLKRELEDDGDMVPVGDLLPRAPDIVLPRPKLLSEVIHEQFQAGVPDKEHHEFQYDPVAWAAERKPYIESKTSGLIPFVPDEVQMQVMRYFWNGGTYFVEKSRQRRISTPLVLAAVHKLLYGFEAFGQPLHMHIVGDKRETAKDVLLQMAKVALSTVNLETGQEEYLTGHDMTMGAERIRYFTDKANGYIQSHTSTRSSGRSYPGNAALLEEFAYMRDAEGVWKSVAPMVEGVKNASLWIVSTPDHEATFHAHMCDHAAEFDAHYLPIDWRGHPGRDEAWRAKEIARLGLLEFQKEHELKRIGTGAPVLNMERLRKFGKKCKVLPNRPLAGHRYSKGVDIGGGGVRDDTVLCVLDITYNPAVVVFCEAVENPRKQVSIEDRRRAIEAFDRKWPGKMYVDCTGNRAAVAMLKSRTKVPVHFSAGDKATIIQDKGEGIRIQSRPRHEMFQALRIQLDNGTIVVHEKKHPALWVSLSSARYPRLQTSADGSQKMQQTQKAKRQGKNVDWFDALMLARIGLGRVEEVHKLPQRKAQRDEEDEGRRTWSASVAAEAKGYRELHMPTPNDDVLGKKW